VATAQGKRAIGTLRVGEQVWAYNPKTHAMELQAIAQVWLNHDNDLVDLTLTIQTYAPHSTLTTRTSEVIHTNKKHPFLTVEQGFLPVGQMVVGMHVERADGNVGVVTGWLLVAGTQTMYNLEVASDHTFTVGDGQWIVHNCGGGGDTENENPLDGVEYSDKVYGQRGGIKKEFHTFPDIVDNYGINGRVTSITGGDGVVRTKVEIDGWYMRREGTFEFIIEPDGTSNHRFFKPWG